MSTAPDSAPAPQQQFAGSTPLPWICSGRRISAADGTQLAGCHVSGSTFCGDTDAANAALIVHVVNSRPALLAEIERLRAALEDAVPLLHHMAHQQRATSVDVNQAKACVIQARAALASSAALANGGGA